MTPINMARAQIELRYRTNFPLYQAFATRLETLLEELIAQAGIEIDHIEARVKTLESFLGKIEQKKYDDAPFDKIKDLVGMRIVTYYQDDVEKIKALIYHEFTIDEDHSVDKTTNLEADKFGYRSLHIIISLAAPRAVLPEWKPYVGLPVEIQVRSILQHAWAVFSRELDYKVPSQAPDKIRRRLFSLSAQLELADDEFTRLREVSRSISQTYKQEVTQGQFELPLDLDSLREFMEQHVHPEDWAAIGVQAGMEAFPLASNKFLSAGIKILLRTLQAVGIGTIAEFERLLPDIATLHAPLQRFVALVKAQGGTIHAVPVDVLALLVSFARAQDVPMGFNWDGKYDRGFVQALRQVIQELV